MRVAINIHHRGLYKLNISNMDSWILYLALFLLRSHTAARALPFLMNYGFLFCFSELNYLSKDIDCSVLLDQFLRIYTQDVFKQPRSILHRPQISNSQLMQWIFAVVIPWPLVVASVNALLDIQLKTWGEPCTDPLVSCFCSHF